MKIKRTIDSFYQFLLSIAIRHFIKQGNSEHRRGFPIIYNTIFKTKCKTFNEDTKHALRMYMKECIDQTTT